MSIVMLLAVPRKPGGTALLKMRRVVAHASVTCVGPNLSKVMSASDLNAL